MLVTMRKPCPRCPATQGAAVVDDPAHKKEIKYDEEGKFDEEINDIDITTVRMGTSMDREGMARPPHRPTPAHVTVSVMGRRAAVLGTERPTLHPVLRCPCTCPTQPLSHANFEATLARYPIAIINFYAP